MKFFVALFLLLAVSTVSAQGVYTPFQPAMNGLWYDSGAVGEGATLLVDDTATGRTLTGLVFEGRRCGDGTCTPGWLYFFGAVTPGATTFPLYASNALTFDTSSLPLDPTLVGTVTLHPQACDAVYAEVVVSGVLVERHWVPLRYERGGGHCYVCPDVDVSPPTPGCGFK